MWRDAFGLSEQSAMRALEQDGLITLTEDEKFARSLEETWGLSRAAAEIAARGRDGGSRAALSRVSLAELAALRPDPANVMHVVAAIEELTTELRNRSDFRDFSNEVVELGRFALRLATLGDSLQLPLLDCDHNRPLAS
jgi:hypothetical protein